MRCFSQFVKVPLIVLLALAHGCALIPDEMPKKSPPTGLIATPPSYYSTSKARYLGQKYQENLRRIVEKIVRNPKTANLQFANNIASVGGIGFFTHSAAKAPDERYLEVILTAPETFERTGDYSAKVHRLFSLYGSDVLEILIGDVDIYREKEVAGYGLNFSWRTIVSETSGPRVILERAVAYFPKEEVRKFLQKEVVENKLLRDAVVFAAKADGPMTLVSYRQQERKPDFRPPIEEEILAAGSMKHQSESKQMAAPVARPRAQPDTESRVEHSEIAPVAKGATGQPEVSPETLTPQDGAKATPDKPAKTGVVAPSPGAPRETSKQETAPEEKVMAQPIVQKPDRSGRGIAEPTERKSGLPTELHSSPRQKSASAPSLPKGADSQPKETETGFQQQATTKAKGADVGGPATNKQTQVTGDLSIVVSRGTPAPDTTGDTRALETLRSPPAAEAKSAPKAASTGTGSTLPAKTRAALGDKVDVPHTVPKPEVKSTEKDSRLPALAAPPKAVRSLSPSLESLGKEKADERQSLPQESVTDEASRGSRQSGMESKTEEQAYPVSPLVSGRAAPAIQTGEVASSKLQKSVESKIPEPSNARSVVPRPSTGTRVVMKERIEAPAPAVENERPVAEKTPPLSSAAMTLPSRQPVEKPVKDEIALLTNKPSTKGAAGKSSARSAPKMLKGYIIQLAFTDKVRAQHWAETLERRGYAVSLTKAGGAESLRVRIGNFPVRHEAERELRLLAKDGLRGIVLNLPDGYRPTESSPTAEIGAVPTAR